MKNSTPFLTLALLSLAFAGCSSVADLGVIELAPNVLQHTPCTPLLMFQTKAA